MRHIKVDKNNKAIIVGLLATIISAIVNMYVVIAQNDYKLILYRLEKVETQLDKISSVLYKYRP